MFRARHHAALCVSVPARHVAHSLGLGGSAAGGAGTPRRIRLVSTGDAYGDTVASPGRMHTYDDGQFHGQRVGSRGGASQHVRGGQGGVGGADSARGGDSSGGAGAVDHTRVQLARGGSSFFSLQQT